MNLKRSCFLWLLVLTTTCVAQTQTPSEPASARGIRPPKTTAQFVRTRQKNAPPKNDQVRSRLGLGVTVYRQEANNQWRSISAEKPFRDGERVRFLIETNTDGYLYLFNATNNGQPVMIFPDGEQDQGQNEVKAHVPYEVPARQAKVNYFELTGATGREQMFFLLTRKPLAGVLREQGLVEYCRQLKRQNANADCVWSPSNSEWTNIAAQTTAEWQSTQSETLGQTPSSTLTDAVSRGIRPPKPTPVPTMVRMRASPRAEKVMLVIELKHLR